MTRAYLLAASLREVRAPEMPWSGAHQVVWDPRVSRLADGSLLASGFEVDESFDGPDSAASGPKSHTSEPGQQNCHFASAQGHSFLEFFGSPKFNKVSHWLTRQFRPMVDLELNIGQCRRGKRLLAAGQLLHQDFQPGVMSDDHDTFVFF